MQLFRTGKSPVRLEKKLSYGERWEAKKEEVEEWTVRNSFILIALTSFLALILFVMICYMVIGSATESNLYYYHLGDF
ncbi:MAG: hypothetical protein Q4P18_07035 [Methanobrevibacter sp.]|uniref:hypothetical protein n=1 Tax=Methanobrevibacter sp. TaxID=66852 RepID=UPI0026DF927B|nr:hypothetical protein [Methanobrevibacter sp.]MDO5849271.1 hypothetical protein [Methanobrevibacter sp.]